MFIALTSLALLLATITAFVLATKELEDLFWVGYDHKFSLPIFTETVRKLIQAHRIEEALDVCDGDKFVYDSSVYFIAIGGNREKLQTALAELEDELADLCLEITKRFRATLIKLGIIFMLISASIFFFARTDEYSLIVIFGIIANALVFVIGTALSGAFIFTMKFEYLQIMPHFKGLAQLLIFCEIPPSEDLEDSEDSEDSQDSEE